MQLFWVLSWQKNSMLSQCSLNERLRRNFPRYTWHLGKKETSELIEKSLNQIEHALVASQTYWGTEQSPTVGRQRVF